MAVRRCLWSCVATTAAYPDNLAEAAGDHRGRPGVGRPPADRPGGHRQHALGDDEADGAPAPRAAVDRFDAKPAWRPLREQVEMGPRPAGSEASRALAERLRELCRGALPDRARRSAQRDRDACRAASGGTWCWAPTTTRRTFPASWAPTTAPRAPPGHRDRPAAQAPAAHDPVHPLRRRGGPRGTPDSEFESEGLRGSRVAARAFRNARAMVLLDFVGDRRLRIPREGYSRPASGAACAAAARVGHSGSSRGRRRAGCSTTTSPSCAWGARHRPDRFRLSLLPPPLRQPVGGLSAQRGRGGGDDLELMRTL